ncbi:MAG: hypothetical protein SH818_05065 [Saprospiraceae bacterium]|nr:hypothetical protein [Saprospiraceae bacterium]
MEQDKFAFLVFIREEIPTQVKTHRTKPRMAHICLHPQDSVHQFNQDPVLTQRIGLGRLAKTEEVKSSNSSGKALFIDSLASLIEKIKQLPYFDLILFIQF